MGDVDMMQYMDTYIRSMRLIYYTTYKYNSNTEVLISLSHYWYDHFEEPNCHPSAHLLKLLIDYTKAEGDFFWGIAFHPYPESLVNPKSWLDKNATMKIDTNLITFKNLEILDAWIQHPKVLYQGITKRTLLLSEQNPNSMDYSEKSQQEQAASLAYVWKKVCACRGIDAYIAHRWIDDRTEGGLKTGLRKYADFLQDPYGKKMAWFVYRALGTAEEDEQCEFAKKIIGINDWKEIMYEIDVN